MANANINPTLVFFINVFCGTVDCVLTPLHENESHADTMCQRGLSIIFVVERRATSCANHCEAYDSFTISYSLV